MKLVGPRLGDEGDDTSPGLAELSLEPVGIDGELGDRFDRRSEVRGLIGVGGAVRVDQQSVQRGCPGAGLAAAQRQRAPAPLRFRGDRDEVIGAAHGAADDQGELVHQLILHGGGNLGVLGLQLRGRGFHFDRFAHGADFQSGVDAGSAARGQRDTVLDEALESIGGNDDPVRAGRQIRRIVAASAGGGDALRDIGRMAGDDY